MPGPSVPHTSIASQQARFVFFRGRHAVRSCLNRPPWRRLSAVRAKSSGLTHAGFQAIPSLCSQAADQPAGAARRESSSPGSHVTDYRAVISRTLSHCFTNYRFSQAGPTPWVGCTMPGPPCSETGTPRRGSSGSAPTTSTRPSPSSVWLTVWPTRAGSR